MDKKNQEKDLLIAKKFSNMYYYAYGLFEKYPKSERFGLVADMKNSLNSSLKYIFYAQKVQSNLKLDYLNKLDAELLYLRFAIRLSHNKRYITYIISCLYKKVKNQSCKNLYISRFRKKNI